MVFIWKGGKHVLESWITTAIFGLIMKYFSLIWSKVQASMNNIGASNILKRKMLSKTLYFVHLRLSVACKEIKGLLLNCGFKGIILDSQEYVVFFLWV